MAQTRGNARVAAVLVLAVVVVALEAGVTRSASAGGKKCGRLSCQTTPTGVSEQGTVTNPASPPANDAHDTHSTGPATQTTYTPPCGHNTPDDGDLMCMEGAVRCDPANPNARYWWVWTRPVRTPPAPWRFQGTSCLDLNQVGGQVPLTPGMVAAAFQQQTFAKAAVTIQPSPKTPVHLLTFFTATLPTGGRPYQEFPNVVLLGQHLVIRAYPTQYHWDFGDGTTAATSSVSTTTQTTHAYTTLGTVNVTVTVVYRGEYALPGGQFQPIPGTAQQTSDPVALTVDQIQSVND